MSSYILKDDNFKDKLIDFVEYLEDSYDINVISYGISSYFYQRVDNIVKITTLSYEPSEIRFYQESYIKGHQSILSQYELINSPKIGQLVCFQKDFEYEVDSSFNNEKYEYFFPESFDANFKDFEQKTASEMFDDWGSFMSSKIGSCYCCRYSILDEVLLENKPTHKNIPDDQRLYFGSSIFLIVSEDFKKTKRKIKFRNDNIDFVNKPQIHNYLISKAVGSYKRNQNLLHNELRISALKSSLAAVMSRNMSHNIGSHVLNQLSNTQAIEYFFKKDKDGSGHVLHSNDGEIYTALNNGGVYKLNKDFLPPLIDNTSLSKIASPRELTRIFNDYLKKRMDFVADVATTNSASFSNNKHLFSEVFLYFQNNLLLLTNIPGKGGEFKYEFELQVVSSNGEIKEGENPLVSMPNDVLGEQAFYIILENIIRNTAKHSGVSLNDNYKRVTFTIQVEDEFSPDFHKVTIYDNIPFEKNEELIELLYKRNESIAKNILKDNNEIRDTDWGTIELKIAACYLSGLPTTAIQEDKYGPIGSEKQQELIQNTKDVPKKEQLDEWYEHVKSKLGEFKRSIDGESFYPILQAVDGHECKTHGFGYSFLMKKPKNILIVDEENKLAELVRNHNNDNESNFFNQLKKIGISVIDSLQSNKIYPHRYVIDLTTDGIKKTSKLSDTIITTYKEDQDKLLKSLKKAISKKQHMYAIEKFIGEYVEDNKQFIPIIEKLEDWNKSHINNNETTPFISHHEISQGTINNGGYFEAYGSSSNLGYLMIPIQNEYDRIKRNRASRRKKDTDERSNVKEFIKNIEIQYSIFFTEAVKSNIIVIDERIQSVLNEPTNVIKHTIDHSKPKLSYGLVFRGMGVTVPDKTNTFNLNDSAIHEKRNDIIGFIKEHSQTSDYVIIHFGIIESMKKGNEKWTLEEVVGKIKKNCNECKLIITSGRGTTPDIQSLNEYFIPYSVISNFLLTSAGRSKAHLINLLKQLRK